MSTTGSNDSWSGTVPTYGASNSNLRLATFQHRLGAYALDLTLTFLTLGIGWFIWSLIVWGQGQTPAKKILKLRVYAADNTQRPATWGHMAVRELLLMMAIGIAAGVLNLFTFIVGTIGIIAWYVMEVVWYYTKGQRTLRDTLVKTLVVNEA
jgi:uncharacterized RDD family membrane protein YckC